MWKLLTKDEELYMIKLEESPDNVEVILTDLKTIFSEILSKDTLLERFQQSNPMIDVKQEEAVSRVKDLVDKVPEMNQKNFEITKSEDTIDLTLKSEVAHFEVMFTCSLSKETPEFFLKEVTAPLIKTVKHLESQQQTLSSVIQKKDRELEEYKMEKGFITRGDLATEKFDETVMNNHLENSMLDVFNHNNNHGETFWNVFSQKYGEIESTLPEVKVDHWNTLPRKRKIYSSQTYIKKESDSELEDLELDPNLFDPTPNSSPDPPQIPEPDIGMTQTFIENLSHHRFGTKTLDEIKAQVQKSSPPINTTRNKTSVWNQFMRFCRNRSYNLEANTPLTKLSEILQDWGYNMRRGDGEEYKEAVVKTMWNQVAKRIQEMYYNEYNVGFDPFSDIIFKPARDARNTKRRELRRNPQKRTASNVALTGVELDKIVRLFDENTPEGLQRKFYHIAARDLAWESTEPVGCLMHHFRQELDHSGRFTGRIEYNRDFVKNVPAFPLVTSKWLVKNFTKPDLCPVRLFHKLCSKRGSEITTDRLFLTVNPFWTNFASKGWYKNSPIGKNSLAKWLKEAAKAVGVDTTNKRIKHPRGQW